MSSSPIRTSSTTACERPFTPNFCMTLLIWLRTVFSLIKSWLAISFVVLSCTSSSKTSLSLLVNIGFAFCSFPFNSAPLLARAHEYKAKASVKLVYDWGKSVVLEGREFRPAPTVYARSLVSVSRPLPNASHNHYPFAHNTSCKKR
jgi:hypothetical protein